MDMMGEEKLRIQQFFLSQNLFLLTPWFRLFFFYPFHRIKKSQLGIGVNLPLVVSTLSSELSYGNYLLLFIRQQENYGSIFKNFDLLLFPKPDVAFMYATGAKPYPDGER